MAEKPDYLIRVRPCPDSVPAPVRLRRLLKAMWRGGYRLWCVSVVEVPVDAPTSGNGGAGQGAAAGAERDG